MQKIDFLEKTQEGYYIVNEGILEIYIPRFLFEQELSDIVGNMVNTIGIFNFTWRKDEDSKAIQLYESTLAVKTQFTYTSKQNSRVSISAGMEADDYTIFRLEKGDKYNTSNKHIQDIVDVNAFISLVNGGKLPQTMKYSDRYQSVLTNTVEMNKIGLGVPSVIIEFTNAELCREKGNPSKAFRKVIGQPDAKVNEYDYMQLSIKELAMNNSTFSAITFEDINKAITNGVNNTLDGHPEPESPVEKIIKY